MENLQVGKKLSVQTANTKYTIESKEDGLYISGHSSFCPTPTKVSITVPRIDNEKYILSVGKIMFYYDEAVSKERTTTPVSEIKEL